MSIEQLPKGDPTSSSDNTKGRSSGNSFEVFRNKTTAVEVTVKEVTNKKADQTCSTVKNIYEDMNKLKSELSKTIDSVVEMRRCYKDIICEMKKQLDAANQREFDLQNKYLNVVLEKEKMTTILNSKAKLIQKLKNELNVMRGVIKCVIKGIDTTSRTSESPMCLCDLDTSGIEYEFKKDVDVHSSSVDTSKPFVKKELEDNKKN